RRRAEVAQESDFFGSMDGASKFVRGDAIAGLLIMIINVLGGLVVGMAQHDMPMGDAARTYTLVTIGEGLVAQLPAPVMARGARQQPSQAAAQALAAAAEASWEDVSMVDPLGLEVGYRLIPLVDHAQNGELLHRIRSLRKKFAQDVGFLPPVVHIRDNLEL